MATRRPSWLVRIMDRHLGVLERAVRQASGDRGWTFDGSAPLGCGVYGCAFRVGGPWVFKVTADRREGPMWAALRKLASRLAAEGKEEAAAAIPRIKGVKDLTRHLPRVTIDGRRTSVHLIVREDVEPLETWDGKSGRWVKSEKARRLGSGFGKLLAAVQLYDEEAGEVERLSRRRPPPPAALVADAESRTRVAAERLAGTKAGRNLGLLLLELAGRGVFMRDVSSANVGFPVRAVIDGERRRTDRLMILDPGHTSSGGMLGAPLRAVANPADPSLTLEGLPDYQGIDEIQVDVLDPCAQEPVRRNGPTREAP